MSFAFIRAVRGAAMAAAMLSGGAGMAWAEVPHPPVPVPQLVTAIDSFLDRLMLAESGGRDHIRNPRSTAFGPFQFLDQTFLELVRRYFQAETAALSPVEVLALRGDRAFARRVAAAFTEENARILSANGLAANWPNLRLAFFAGPAGAVRILKGPSEASVLSVLGPAVIRANPFLARMRAADLIGWSANTIAGRRIVHLPVQIAAAAPSVLAAPYVAGTAHKWELPAVPSRIAVRVPPVRVVQAKAGKGGGPASAGGALGGVATPTPAALVVRVPPACNLARASCRQWVALAERRQMRQRQAALRRDVPAAGSARR